MKEEKVVNSPYNKNEKRYQQMKDDDSDLATREYKQYNINRSSSINEKENKFSVTSSKIPSLLIVHLAIITAQVSFGGGSVVGSLGMPSTNPVLFALIREGIAGPLLCILAFLIDKNIPDWRDWKLFLAPGLALFVNQFCFIVGLKISSSITASAWQPSQGILAVIFGYCFGIERHIDKFKILGITIGTCGALFMIIFGNHDTSGGSISIWSEFGGSLMFFLNCSATVWYLILSRPAFKKYPSTTITGYSYIVASFLMVITAFTVASSPTILKFLCSDCDGAWQVPTVTIYALIYWILMQSLLSYLLMTWANKYADPSVNCAYTVLQPLTATVASELLLLFGVIDNCNKYKTPGNHSCLYRASWADLGAIGIGIGLYFVIYSDRKKREQEIKDLSLKRPHLSERI